MIHFNPSALTPYEISRRKVVGLDRYGRPKDTVSCKCEVCKEPFEAYYRTARFCPPCRDLRAKFRKSGVRKSRAAVVLDSDKVKCIMCPRIVPRKTTKRGCCSGTCIVQFLAKESK